MKREYWLIDGYNVINAWPELAALGDLEFARDRLVQMMTNYGAFCGHHIRVVFDAPGTPDRESSTAAAPQVEVVFTAEGETADSYIEREAYALAARRETVYVVTSDWAEQMVILGAGAYRISAREFLAEVKKAARRMAEAGRGGPAVGQRRELEGRISPAAAQRLDELRRRR